jgi:hypothetical protein
LQGRLDRIDFRYGGFGRVHLLLQSRQILVPRVEKMGFPGTANRSGPTGFQQIGVVLFLLDQAGENDRSGGLP